MISNIRESMEKFYCESCKEIFEAKGKKKEYQSSIYGPCWKYVVNCPKCGTECNEYKPISSSKKKPGLPNCGCGCGACGI